MDLAALVMMETKRPSSLNDDLLHLVATWRDRAVDPVLNAGCQAGFYFAACGLSEVLQSHGVDIEPVWAATKGSS